jgi:predicted DNA-binding transcriptional regulator AlpA
MSHKTDQTEHEEKLISRERLAERWDTSVMTIKRMENTGDLRRISLCKRLVRYRLSDVLEFERKGGR